MKKFFTILLLGMSLSSLFATAVHAEDKADAGATNSDDVVASDDPDC